MQDPFGAERKAVRRDLPTAADRAPARAHYRAMGIEPEALERPIVGVAGSWTGTMPCNVNHRPLSDALCRSIDAAGGLAMPFNTVAVSDNQTQGTPGMRASLVSREVIADSIELMCRAHDFEALVCIVGCDKTVPAALMAIARLDLPAVVVYSGPSRPGTLDGRTVTIQDMWEELGRHQRGLAGREQLDVLERVSCPGIGTCAGHFTANSMGLALDFLGLAIAGDGFVPADDLETRSAAMDRVAETALALAREGTTARAFLTPTGLRNAMRAVAATGGSTNSFLHLLAISREAGVPVDVDELGAIAAQTPVLASLLPGGRHAALAFHEAGGSPVLMRSLAEAGMLEDAPTVDGRTLAGIAAAAPEPDGDVLSPAGQPFKPAGALRVLRGSLAPGSAVTKLAGTERHVQRGPARVFDGEEACIAAIADGTVAGGRRRRHPRRGPGRWAGDARAPEGDGGDRRRRPRRARRARHRRALLRRHARTDDRPREPGGRARRADRGRPRRRPDRDRPRRGVARRRARPGRAATAPRRVARARAGLRDRALLALRGGGRLGGRRRGPDGELTGVRGRARARRASCRARSP